MFFCWGQCLCFSYVFCLYNLGYGVFGIAEIYLTILAVAIYTGYCIVLGRGVTESGDTYQELMSVIVMCHV